MLTTHVNHTHGEDTVFVRLVGVKFSPSCWPQLHNEACRDPEQSLHLFPVFICTRKLQLHISSTQRLDKTQILYHTLLMEATGTAYKNSFKAGTRNLHTRNYKEARGTQQQETQTKLLLNTQVSRSVLVFFLVCTSNICTAVQTFQEQEDTIIMVLWSHGSLSLLHSPLSVCLITLCFVAACLYLC